MEKEKTMALGTIPAMFWEGVRTRGPQTIYRQKAFGIWQPVSWDALGESAREIGMGLVSLGYEPGEVVSVLSSTNKDWMCADLGALCAAGVVNGIYPTDAPAQVEYLLADSGSVHVFVEDEEQLDKVLEVRARLPKLRKIIVFDMEGLHELNDPQVLSLERLRALGKEYNQAHPGEWQQRIGVRKSGDLAILVYTSGTTGKPKGAMLSHSNLMASIRCYGEIFSQGSRDERMAFLPLAHVAERVLGVYTALHSGTVLNFVENPDTVPENVREISPTVFGAVPRIWEKFYSGVLIGLKEAGPLQQWAYKLAIGIGYRLAKLREERKPIPAGLGFAFWFARMLVLNNVRKLIGVHRARILVTGAAPTSPDLVRWYMALGLDMVEVWGMT
jgi:long-chain acyl-CoA synthetase